MTSPSPAVNLRAPATRPSNGPEVPEVLPLRRHAWNVVSASVATVNGRRVVFVSFDATNRSGALGAEDGETMAAAARLALRERLPLIAVVASSGADVQEGVTALHGWGKAGRELVRCSGVVPMLFALTGPAVSGPALLIGLADHVVMTRNAYAFVSGPRMVRQFTGVPVSNEILGGAGAHANATGVASLVVENMDEALDALGDLLMYLPDSVDDPPPRYHVADPPDRLTPEAGAVLPASATGSYDVRDIIRALVDDADFLEVRARWAPNLVTGFATVAGHPVGVVANQPCRIAGTLDIPASQKGARFVSFCDSFNLPLVTLIDTPGFYPGKDLEWRGMIRHGAQMAFAYARATVPRISIALRKCYGGAYIVMDSKTMGSDLALAWPSAEIAVMGAKGAVEILHRGASPEEKQAAERDYEDRLLNPYIAAERGLVDMVIDPADTRRELASALELLASKTERLPQRLHDNTPL